MALWLEYPVLETGLPSYDVLTFLSHCIPGFFFLGSGTSGSLYHFYLLVENIKSPIIVGLFYIIWGEISSSMKLKVPIDKVRSIFPKGTNSFSDATPLNQILLNISSGSSASGLELILHSIAGGI